jgi:hypothetical protein
MYRWTTSMAQISRGEISGDPPRVSVSLSLKVVCLKAALPEAIASDVAARRMAPSLLGWLRGACTKMTPKT